MNNKIFDTLILGATFSGVGLCLSNNNSIIIERTSLIGSEFVDSFNEKEGKKIDIKTSMGEQFKKILISRGLLNEEGDIYSAPAMFTLCDFIKKKDLNILFLTEVTKIQKTNNGYEITIFNCEGFSTIYASRFIDTTSQGIMHDSILNANATKYLNAAVYGENKKPISSRGYITTNNITNKSIFHFQVDISEGWFDVRKNFNEFLIENQADFNGWRVKLISSTFAYIMPTTRICVDDNFLWIPSCSNYNLLQAFDEGCLI